MIEHEEEWYGEDRLHKVVTSSLDLQAVDILDKIVEDVDVFRQGAAQFDDLTITVIKAE